MKAGVVCRVEKHAPQRGVLFVLPACELRRRSCSLSGGDCK